MRMLTFHLAKFLPTQFCLQPETKSAIVLFHMSFKFSRVAMNHLYF